jgi:hypothetical protein
MAVDAFRRTEAMQRRLAKAQADLHAAVRLVPTEDMEDYWRLTEIIRLEFDQKAAKDEHDQESVDFCTLRIAELRRDVLRTITDVEADRLINEAGQCTATSWRAGTKATYGPGGYNRCIKQAHGADEPHEDGFGNKFQLEPTFKVLPR